MRVATLKLTPATRRPPVRPRRWWALLALALLAVVAGCYNSNTGETTIGGALTLTLPAFPESGPHAVEIFTEMHYQPSYRSQEGPRLLPPVDSVPVTGKELRYASLDDYRALEPPESLASSYEAIESGQLYRTNCQVCHGARLNGEGSIVAFMDRGPFPADLTGEGVKGSTDGELFGFISAGGRQGLAARSRGLESASPMPEFRLLLSEEERWKLVLFLRSPFASP